MLVNKRSHNEYLSNLTTSHLCADQHNEISAKSAKKYEFLL